jgi:hypothetical protein
MFAACFHLAARNGPRSSRSQNAEFKRARCHTIALCESGHECRAMLLIDVDLWNGGQPTVASALEAES